ncbi:MAG: O-antigen ligase family protein [Pirellulales bacterium]|nr:O-antigen ligase family protein [Pirellulales bacterium]
MMSILLPNTDASKPLEAPQTGGGPDQVLLRVVDVALGGCVVVVPLCLGGWHPLGRLALVALSVMAAVAWLARRIVQGEFRWRRSAAEPLLVGAVLLVVFQMVPWPAGWLAWLSPKAAEVLPLWFADGESSAGLGGWATVSLAPAATRAALEMLLAYGLLFLVAVQRLSRIEDVERVLRWCAFCALGMAAFGLVQFLTSNGKFFWFYEHPYQTTSDAVQGSFVNRNHFAHFLALGIGPLLWWIQDSLRHRRHRRTKHKGSSQQEFAVGGRDTGLRWLGVGLILLAGLLSLSRGGMIALFGAGAIAVVVLHQARRLRVAVIGGLAAAAVLVGVALAIFGHQGVTARLDDFASGSIDTLDASGHRRAIWSAGFRAAADFPILGTGAGSQRWIHPMYLDPTGYPGFAQRAGRIHFLHADNGPLEIALETGIPGVLLLVVGLAILARWCVIGLWRAESSRERVAAGAVTAALAASLLHNLVDCPWYVPGCMVVVVLLAAGACRLCQLTADETARRAQRRAYSVQTAWMAAGVVAIVGGWLVWQQVGPAVAESSWHTYQLIARRPSEATDADGLKHDMASETLTVDENPSPSTLDRIIGALEDVVQSDPRHAEARMLLAGYYLQRFERLQETSPINAMPLSAVREAAIASRFASRGELDAWLARSVGPHAGHLEQARRHTRQALAVCPLQAIGYLHLAELGFLEGRVSRSGTSACVAQAMRLGPFNGAVLRAAAEEAILAGNQGEGIALWQRAYRCGRADQQALLCRLAGRICPENPASDVAFFLNTFQPDLVILRQLESVYTPRATDAQLVALRRCHADAAEAAAQAQSGPSAAKFWREARLARYRLGDMAGTLECLRRACECDPNDYDTRHRLALDLARQQCYGEAREHIQWCLDRQPDDPALREVARQVTRYQASRQAQTDPRAPNSHFRR